MHVACDQKRSRRLLGEPLFRQASARIDQNRKVSLRSRAASAQARPEFLLTGSHSQQRISG